MRTGQTRMQVIKSDWAAGTCCQKMATDAWWKLLPAAYNKEGQGEGDGGGGWQSPAVR